MNAAETKFMHEILEFSAEKAYALGYSDAITGKPEQKHIFKMSKGAKLSLRTLLTKHVEKR